MMYNVPAENYQSFAFESRFISFHCSMLRISQPVCLVLRLVLINILSHIESQGYFLLSECVLCVIHQTGIWSNSVEDCTFDSEAKLLCHHLIASMCAATFTSINLDENLV
jgi:hypothetical protein